LLLGTGSDLRTATERSVTLLRVFLLASAVIVALGGVVLSSAQGQDRGRPHRPALGGGGPGRGAARLRPPARGLHADLRLRRPNRPRRLRDLLRPEGARAD